MAQELSEAFKSTGFDAETKFAMVAIEDFLGEDYRIVIQDGKSEDHRKDIVLLHVPTDTELVCENYTSQFFRWVEGFLIGRKYPVK